MCTSPQILAYQKRLSGTLLDRIDLGINVARVPNSELITPNIATNLQQIDAIKSVKNAQFIQHNRYKNSLKNNANFN